MFNRLKRLYAAGRIDKSGLERAVSFGYITEDQMKEIIETDESSGN